MPRERYNKDKHFEELAKSFAEGARTYMDTSEAEELIDYLIGKESNNEALAISDYALSLHSSSTSLLIQHATILIILWRVEEARDILNYVSPLEQQNPNLHIAWGDLHVKDGDIIKGLECYDKAIEFSTDKGDYLDTLLMIASRLNRDEQWTYVQKYADLYFQKKPNDPNMLFELAYAEEKCDNLEKSMEIYENLLQRDPFSDSGWYNLALIYTNLGKYDLAQKAFDNAISLDPNPEFAHCNYGNMYQYCGEYAKAIEQYSLYIANSKNTPDFDVSVYELLSDCFFNWALKEAEQIDGVDSGAQLSLEIINNEHILYLLTKTIEFSKLCIEEKFDEARAWMQVGDCYSIIGDHDKGLSCMDKAIRIEPDNHCCYYMKAAVYERQGKLHYALQYLLDGLSLDPEPAKAWIECAKTLYKISSDKSNPERVPPLKVFNVISGRFPNGPYITVAKCFLEYLEGTDSAKTFEALRNVAENHPGIFFDACEDASFQSMLQVNPYNNLIQDI